MNMLKILTAVREDLRNFYVPAWLNKASPSRAHLDVPITNIPKMPPASLSFGGLSWPRGKPSGRYGPAPKTTRTVALHHD